MSLQITITPKDRASGRFISRVRRSIQKAFAQEKAKRGLTQSDVARALGVNRSVISREIRGHKDISLGRVGEISWALGRIPEFDLAEPADSVPHSNVQTVTSTVIQVPANNVIPANNNAAPAPVALGMAN